MKLFEKINGSVKKKQLMNGVAAIACFIGVWLIFSLMFEKAPVLKKETKIELTGITGEEFTESNTESAVLEQQDDIGSLKAELLSTNKALKAMEANQEKLLADLSSSFESQTELVQRISQLEAKPEMAVRESAQGLGGGTQQGSGRLMRVSFRKPIEIEKNNETYVPAGTYASAIILLGADADASVNGQSQQSPMAFKLLDNGKIPGGGHSKLKSCVVLAGAYGDISSERVNVRLTHITCKYGANKVIESDIEGWASYNGKANIKGVPLMRDDKILAWAGLSGMMSGFANAMQYSNTTQSVSALGSTSTVNSDDVAAYGLYGGAASAMNNLSNYYIKRADQYHPVIQVGAGNKVSILFKTGFFIVENDKDKPVQPVDRSRVQIPASVLKQIQNNTNTNSFGQTVGVQK